MEPRGVIVTNSSDPGHKLTLFRAQMDGEPARYWLVEQRDAYRLEVMGTSRWAWPLLLKRWWLER